MSDKDWPEEQLPQSRRRELIENARRQVEKVQGEESSSPDDSPVRNECGVCQDENENGNSVLPPFDSFAGYRILKEIHRGAQGVVYQAIQESTKRKVAIKVMKEGPFAGSADRARFEREVKLLGQLDHPNIVTIFGTGEASNCHYFVMDYISGQPLDVYMASDTHPVEEILTLFFKICSAVESAHLRGIIHRDLKPGNIRVNPKGEPYILDFGLAKSSNDTDTSAATLTGRFLGTPAWASPEQAQGVSCNVDIRSDVYSLGVILYQMLTGRFPYKVTGSTQEVLDRIKKSEPLRPRDIHKKIDDEVETIVLKCLQKDPERRYQSAGELARDIKRYLVGEPIEAKRDSLSYLFRKQLLRYKPQATIAACFLLIIMVSLVVSLWLLGEAKRAEASERRQRQRAEDYARELRLANSRIEAEHRALMENHGVAFKLFDDVAAFLEEGGLSEAPDLDSALRHMLGRNCRRTGRLEEAYKYLLGAWKSRCKHLGVENAVTLNSANELGRVYLAQGEYRYPEAERLFNDTLDNCRRVLGMENTITLDCMHNLALLYKRRAKYEEAKDLYEQVLAVRSGSIGSEHEDTLNTMNNLAALYAQTGKLEEAASMHERVLETRRRVLKENHRYILNSMSSLGGVYTTMGRYKEARKLLEEAVAGARLTLPDGHSNTAVYLKYYGRLLLKTGEYLKAEKALVESYTIMAGKYGEKDGRTLRVADLLAELYEKTNRPEKAAQYDRSISDASKPVDVEIPG